MSSPPAKKPSVIPVGTLIAGKYRITREIGRGGMAAVYEALHVDIGKRVAVKVLDAELINSTVVVERFLREARAAAAVNSPYICDVYDAGKLEDGRPFLLLELLEGDSLYERMVKVRRFDPDFVIQVFSQVCRGLSKAHGAGIIHRDLKPENIFLTKTDDGEVLAKLLDFGLAKFYAPVDGGPIQARLTREGAVFGTPAYMSPEQVQGAQEQVDQRADLWAIGCMVYECFTGRTVWTTEQGVAMIFAQIATADLPVPSARRPDLPHAFDSWFFKALARNPIDRFQTARELADALVVCLESVSLHPPPVELLQPVDMEESAQFAADEAPTRKLVVPTPESPPATLIPELKAIPPQTPLRAPKPSRTWVTLAGATAVAAIASVVWYQFIRQSELPESPVAGPGSSQKLPASTRPGQPLLPPPASAADLPPWAVKMRSGQEALAKGNFPGAVAAFKEASDLTPNGAPRVFLENAQMAARRDGICSVVALGRPRPFDLTTPVRRPDLTHTVNGPLVTWADDHEVPGQWHAWTVLLDDQLRPLGRPVDVTPEATSVQEPRVLSTNRQVVLLFTDPAGTNAGAFVRQLSTAGRILGEPIRVTATKTALTWPTIAAAPKGGYWVAFTNDDDRAPSSQVFLLPLTSNLKPDREPILVAEVARKVGPLRARTRAPSLSLGAGGLVLAYRIERGREHDVVRQRIALEDPTLTTGLITEPTPNTDRSIGDVQTVSDRTTAVQYPVTACDGGGCYVVWREEPQGDTAAYVNPAAGTVIWRKRFAPGGGQVAVGVDGSGGGLLAWYEGGLVRIAPVGSDGIRESTTIARVVGEQVRPSIARGAKPGEWLLAWTDLEAGHVEAYAARVLCK